MCEISKIIQLLINLIKIIPFIISNQVLTLMGTGLLWFGCYGFNVVSAVASGALEFSVFAATHFSASAATMSWMAIEWLHREKPVASGAASVAVAWLAAITQASGYVGVMSSIIIGLVAEILCYVAVQVKAKLKFDDTLDVIGVH